MYIVSYDVISYDNNNHDNNNHDNNDNDNDSTNDINMIALMIILIITSHLSKVFHHRKYGSSSKNNDNSKLSYSVNK